MLGTSAKVMFIGIRKNSTIAKRQLPPIADFNCTSLAVSILWLAILEMLLSNPQNAIAVKIKRLPSLFISKIKVENSRLVVIIMTPTRTNAIARYPIGLSFSLKNTIANKTVNTISALDKTEVSDALLCARPLKYRSGAITAPDILIAKIKSQSFLFISDILAFFFDGVAVKPAKR